MNFVLGVDVGGTFTDLCALGEQGEVRIGKVPTSQANPAASILRGIAELCKEGDRVTRTVLGTTAGLNAVLERRGAKTALITTAGFRDIYQMARGDRPRMYDLHYHRPTPLIPREAIFELPERLDAHGTVIVHPEPAKLDEIACAIAAQGFESVAVCLLHSYRNPQHEHAVAAVLKRHAPDCSVSLSHRVAREWREYERTSTTIIDAYIRPALERHLDELRRGLVTGGHQPEVLLMRSSGGLMPTANALLEPISSLLSGPVGGAIATRELAGRLELDEVLAIDMGGTSFDVTLLSGGALPLANEITLEGFPVLVASVPVHTIGAGGGGIVWLEGRGQDAGLRVGPHSAGAIPGPACYRRGGNEPTVTDANACLGRIGSGSFMDGALALDVTAAKAAFAPLSDVLEITPQRLYEGVVNIVDARMVGAIRALTVERGLDARTFCLVAYGGNGPLHATALAEALGISQVVVPAAPGAFSAWGMLFAHVRKDLSLTLLQDSTALRTDALSAALGQLMAQADAFLAEVGLERHEASYQWRADMRYRGQEHSVDVPLLPPPVRGAPTAFLEQALSHFHRRHRQRYGHAHPQQVVEFVTLRLGIVGPSLMPDVLPAVEQPAEHGAATTRRIRWRGTEQTVPVLQRDRLPQSGQIAGPCIVEELTATTFVANGWSLRVNAASRSLLLEREKA